MPGNQRQPCANRNRFESCERSQARLHVWHKAVSKDGRSVPACSCVWGGTTQKHTHGPKSQQETLPT